MPKYKVILYFPDGTKQECEDIFDTEEEAIEYGNDACGDYRTGAEILHLSNPGDYPLEDDDELDYEVIEIDD